MGYWKKAKEGYKEAQKKVQKVQKARRAYEETRVDRQTAHVLEEQVRWKKKADLAKAERKLAKLKAQAAGPKQKGPRVTVGGGDMFAGLPGGEQKGRKRPPSLFDGL